MLLLLEDGADLALERGAQLAFDGVERAGEALDVVKSVMKRFAEEGPTQRELDEAKTYLTGSYALRFDSNAKIASPVMASVTPKPTAV